MWNLLACEYFGVLGNVLPSYFLSHLAKRDVRAMGPRSTEPWNESARERPGPGTAIPACLFPHELQWWLHLQSSLRNYWTRALVHRASDWSFLLIGDALRRMRFGISLSVPFHRWMNCIHRYLQPRCLSVLLYIPGIAYIPWGYHVWFCPGILHSAYSPFLLARAHCPWNVPCA